jgi:MFS family permease
MASTVNWTTSLAMLLNFGSESERPIYIGMANTFIAPVVILAPIFGGWMADAAGYQATFLISAIFGLITAGVALFKIRDSREKDEPMIEIA